MKCSHCGKEIPADELHSHQGQTLCEDCYIEGISPEKHCDPWATYLSSRERGTIGIKSTEDFTETEKAIYEFVKSKGRATREEVMAELGLSANDLEPQINVLMHAELLKERSEGDTMYLIPVPVAR